MNDATGIPDLSALTAAWRRIAPHVHRTPLLRNSQLGAIAGGEVYLKCENLQRTGSFKIRGAMNAVLSLDASARARGVVTYSSGNHGQALALAARIAGVRAVVCMPENAPRPKVDAAIAYGAKVRFAGTTSRDRKLAAEEAVAREGLVMVPPFDDAHVIAGQASVGFEIAEQLPETSLVLAPAGGGGLLSGISLVTASSLPGREMIGVEPDTANCVGAALSSGRPVEISPSRSIADGLLPLCTGELPFRICSRHVSRMITVDESAIHEAVRFVIGRAKLVVEPSGCVGVAALLSGLVALNGRTAVVVLSGGNVDPNVLSGILTASSV